MKLDFFSTSNILIFSPKYINYYYIINLIVVMLTTTSIIIYKYYNKKDYYLIVMNVLFELLFNIFLIKKSIFFMFISKLIQFIYSIHLNEVIFINKKSAKLYVPYIIWSYILTLFTIVILLLNIAI